MELPLSVLHNITEEAEDHRVQRCKADATDHTAEDHPVEIKRIQAVDEMPRERDRDADDGHIAFAEPLEKRRAEEQGKDDGDDHLEEQQNAEQRAIVEDVLAVVRQ